MRILILSNKSGAMVDFRYELITELLKSNEVIIATPFDDKMDELRKLPVKLIEVPVDRRGINPIKDLHLLNHYLRIIRTEKPDIITTYTIKPNIYGGIACQLKHTPYVVNVTGLGTAFQEKGFIKRIVVFLYKIALRKAKVIFFENYGNKDALVSEGICQESRTCVLSGAGVNLDKFHYLPYPLNNMFHFLFVGRVMREKGINELIEAMEMLQQERLSCVLDIVGPCEEDYKALLNRKEIDGLLFYHGYQPDVHKFIERSDCSVLPSWHEGMANTNLECAASGRPIITSNIPGCKEAVINGVSGFLCESQNVDSLYSNMKKMIAISREERERMGLAGRAHMEDQFDKRNVVATTIEKILC